MFAKSKKIENSGSFADLIKDVPIPEKHASTLRAKQLDMVGKMAIVMVLANLVNCAVILMAFSDSSADKMLVIWGFSIVFVNGATFLMQIRSRAQVRKRRSQRSIDRYARGASINGLVWAIAPIIVMNVTDPHGQMIMGIILAGMMFAGAFLLSRLPDAAFSFIVPVAIGTVISMQFQQNPEYHFVSVLVLMYVGVLMLAVRWSHRQFVTQHLNEAAVQEQSQLIGLLLRDFEESTSDWLWQTDAKGLLQDIPLILTGDEARDQTSILKVGTDFVGLFEGSEVLTVLESALTRRQAFRDLVVEIVDGDQEQWWSITGKPIFEGEKYRGFRGVATDVTQSKEIEDRIAYMAHFDGLTGLPNRMNNQEHLEKAARRPVEAGRERALIWLDLDNFKWVNDTLGHPAGDELLRQVAGRIGVLCEDGDHVARLGGDEFAMIVERIEGELEPFLDQLCARLSEPYDVWGSTANCTCSIGMRMFDNFTTDSRILLKHADLALYQAKNLGKANWCRFTPDLEDRARARLQVEADLNQALDNDELRVYFQPLVDATTHEMVGVETLLRWHHPKRGLVFPGEFIEHAEGNGLITRMGDWVIRAAMEEAKRLPEHVKISVNISPLQIHSASLMTTIVNAIAANGIDASRLELEITESVLMSDTEFTLMRLHQLKDLGCRIALDDFGTGFSSLSYLRSFPFDKIKIDKSFVSDLEHRSDSRAIAIATLNLARSLGMRCTAEGVETRYQADFLRDNGCDELQGFFISRAQPLDKLSHIIDIAPREVPSETSVERLNRPSVKENDAGLKLVEPSDLKTG